MNEFKFTAIWNSCVNLNLDGERITPSWVVILNNCRLHILTFSKHPLDT